MPPDSSRTSRLPAIELPTIVPETVTRVNRTPPAVRQARTTTATVHQSVGGPLSATTVLFDILKDEREARRYGKFLDRKAAQHAEKS